MDTCYENGILCIRMNDGDDFFESLKDALARYDVRSGVVLSGVGMFRDITVNYFRGDGYNERHLPEPHEVVSITGSIAPDAGTGEVLPHIHCALAGGDNVVMGGHLSRATVNVLLELFIQSVAGGLMRREINPSNGLKELRLVE